MDQVVKLITRLTYSPYKIVGKRDLGRKWNLVKMYRYVPDLGEKKVVLIYIMDHQARADVMIFLLCCMFHMPSAFSWLRLLTQRDNKPVFLKDLSPYWSCIYKVSIIFTNVKIILGGDPMYPQESVHTLPLPFV